MVTRDRQEQQVRPEQRAGQVVKVHKDYRALVGTRDRVEHKEHKEHKGHKETKEHPV